MHDDDDIIMKLSLLILNDFDNIFLIWYQWWYFEKLTKKGAMKNNMNWFLFVCVDGAFKL